MTEALLKKYEIRDWYNAYSHVQFKRGVNLRHYRIVNFLCEFGLKSNHKILEIGCGVGKLTQLIAKIVKNGLVTGIDISDQSIAVAINSWKELSNIIFQTNDIRNFQSDEKFDFIILPDVLEHIPVEFHNAIFQSIAKFLHVDSQVIVHIPHPKLIEQLQKNDPKKLQIIDQALEVDVLITNAYKNNLRLKSCFEYSIFNKEPDYILIQFVPDSHINFTSLRKPVIAARKFSSRINFFANRFSRFVWGRS